VHSIHSPDDHEYIPLFLIVNPRRSIT